MLLQSKRKEQRRPTGRTIAYAGVLVALAMIFSYIEVLVPFNFGIPGIKLGLANLVIVVGLYLLSPQEVLVISLVRIFLSAALFGNTMSLLYSLAGGILSFIVMLGLKRIKGFSVIGVSIAGGIAHNIGQLMAAICVVENLSLVTYLPVLLVAGVLTGFLIGILSHQILRVMHNRSKQLKI